MNNYTACLDHIFVLDTSQFIKDSLSEIKSIIKEDVINTSDHHAVFMEIHFNKLLVKFQFQFFLPFQFFLQFPKFLKIFYLFN